MGAGPSSVRTVQTFVVTTMMSPTQEMTVSPINAIGFEPMTPDEALQHPVILGGLYQRLTALEWGPGTYQLYKLQNGTTFGFTDQAAK